MWELFKWVLGLGLLLIVIGGCTHRVRLVVTSDSHLIATDSPDLIGAEK